MSTEQVPEKENKFTTAVKPYLAFVDSPDLFTKPYLWLFYLIAIVHLLAPIYAIYFLIDNSFFEYASGKILVAGILALIVLFIAGWITFQIWLNRKEVIVTDKVTSDLVIDALGHLVHTACEAFSTWVGIVGTLTGLLALIFGGELLEFAGIRSGGSIGLIIGSLVGGYFGVILAKLIGFLFKKIAKIIVLVVVRVFKFLVHIIVKLFEFFFVFWQSIVDYNVNGWNVVIALVAKLGNTLLAFAHRKGPDNSNQASVTYNS
jgi:hypothetical protein